MKISQGHSNGYSYSPASVITLSEFFKLLLSLFFLKQTHSESFVAALYEIKAVPLSALAQIGVLATMYAINNQITFVTLTLVSPAMEKLAKSGCCLVSAIMLYFLLGRKIVGLQWVALVLQLCGQILAQDVPTSDSTIQSSSSMAPAALIFGIMAFALTLSSLCGVLNDKLVKTDNLSIHVINAWLYGLGFLYNAVLYNLTKLIPEWYGQEHAPESFFAGYTIWTVLIVIANTLIGLAISAVYKYADAVIKTLSSGACVALLLVFGSFWPNEPVGHIKIIGCVIVFIGTYLYMIGPKLQWVGDHAKAIYAPVATELNDEADMESEVIEMLDVKK